MTHFLLKIDSNPSARDKSYWMDISTYKVIKYLELDAFTVNIFSLQHSRWNISWRKTIFGFVVLFLVTIFWVGATQFLKMTYTILDNGRTLNNTSPNENSSCSNREVSFKHTRPHTMSLYLQFSAPFFSCWFCTGWPSLFFPLFFLIRLFRCQKKHNSSSINYQHMNFSNNISSQGARIK